MPDYIVNGIIGKGGKVYRTGDTITLSEEQAAALGTRVVPTNVANPDKPFSEMTVKELRPLAKAAGVPSYSTKDRGELITALDALAVGSNESDSD